MPIGMNTIGIIALLAGIAMYMGIILPKKKDAGIILAVIGGALFFGGAGLGALGGFGDQLAIPTTAEITVPHAPSEPAESVKAVSKNKYTLADSSANLDMELYTKGADVASPAIAELSKTDFSSGAATDTSLLFLVNDNQGTKDLWMEGASDYYNELVPDWDINYNVQTGKGIIQFGDLNYYAARPIGTLSDFDSVDASSSSDIIEDNGTDTFNYNETDGSGTFWMEWDIGNEAADTELNNVVICFQDVDGTLEGTEVTSLTVTRVSGTSVDDTGVLSGDVSNLLNDGAGSANYNCRALASHIGESTEGRYRFTFAVSEANWASGEQIRICLDDNGNYGKLQYPDGNAKASASCATIHVLE